MKSKCSYLQSTFTLTVFFQDRHVKGMWGDRLFLLHALRGEEPAEDRPTVNDRSSMWALSHVWAKHCAWTTIHEDQPWSSPGMFTHLCLRDSGRRGEVMSLFWATIIWASFTYPTSQENHFFLLYLSQGASESVRVLSTLYSLTHLTRTTAL